MSWDGYELDSYEELARHLGGAVGAVPAAGELQTIWYRAERGRGPAVLLASLETGSTFGGDPGQNIIVTHDTSLVKYVASCTRECLDALYPRGVPYALEDLRDSDDHEYSVYEDEERLFLRRWTETHPGEALSVDPQVPSRRVQARTSNKSEGADENPEDGA